MISIREYLFANTPDKDSESTYRRVIGLLLRGISLHAVEGEKSDYEKFRADMVNMESETGELRPEDLLVVAGTTMRALEEYNQRTSRFIRRQTVELQKMVTMLTETVISLGTGAHQSVGRLQEIEKGLESASAVEDMQSLKASLSDCLKTVREEALRQKTDGERTVRKLKQQLADAQESQGGAVHAVDLDKVTGLPDYEEALKAIQAALVSSKRTYVVTAVVGRVPAVNARFGYAVGDRLLNVFLERFRNGLAQQDAIYRWRGPVLVALLERDGTIDQVRSEIRRFADVKQETMLEVGARTVLMPISAGWSVFAAVHPIEGLIKKIESFVASQVPKE
ncbi:MAG: diguanylate cyclase domain-containing protein [Bryobacteraceae bacterium]